MANTAGEYSVRKRFRHLETTRKNKDLPWSKNVLDLDNHLYFGRTGWGWARIVCFYSLLYVLIFTILISMTLTFIYVFHQGDSPLWLKKQPGFSMVPYEDVINFNADVPTDTYKYADVIDDFLDKFNATIFDEFNKDKVWGYHARVPTVFIKVNKIDGFTPKTYDSEDDLPSGSPAELNDLLAQYPGTGKIWMLCDSKSSIIYKFIPAPYFDTKNTDAIHRVIGVQLNDLPENKEVSITCTMWAKNIEIDERYFGVGNVRFYIKMYVS